MYTERHIDMYTHTYVHIYIYMQIVNVCVYIYICVVTPQTRGHHNLAALAGSSNSVGAAQLWAAGKPRSTASFGGGGGGGGAERATCACA